MAHAEKGVSHIPCFPEVASGRYFSARAIRAYLSSSAQKVGKKRHNSYGPHTYRRGWLRMEDVTLIGLDLGTQGVRAIASTPTG